MSPTEHGLPKLCIALLSGLLSVKCGADAAPASKGAAPKATSAIEAQMDVAAGAPQVPPLALDPEGRPRPVELTFAVTPEEERRVLQQIDWSSVARTGDAADVRRFLIAAARAESYEKVESAFRNLSGLCVADGKVRTDRCGTMRRDLWRVSAARAGSREWTSVSQAVFMAAALARGQAASPADFNRLLLQVVRDHPEPAARRAALENAPSEAAAYSDPVARELLLVGFGDADPAVARHAANDLRVRAWYESFARPALGRVTTIARKRILDADPGVRAWAAMVLGNLHPAAWQRERFVDGDTPPLVAREQRAQAAASVRPLLKDPDPVARAAAAMALGWMLDYPSSPQIAALLNDTASTMYEPKGFDDSLTGHFAHPREVRYSAAAALAFFARSTGSEICPSVLNMSAKECVSEVRAWAAANAQRPPAFQ